MFLLDGPVAGVRVYLDYGTKEEIEGSLESHDGQTDLTAGTGLKIIVNTGRGDTPDNEMREDIEKRMQELMIANGIETPKGDIPIAAGYAKSGDICHKPA